VGPSTKVYSVWNDRPTSLSKSMRTVLTLSVPAGSYVAIAKAVGSNSSGTDFTVACGLIAAGRFFDESSASGSGYSSAVVSNQVAFSTDTTADVTLSCANGSGVLGADSVRNKKLFAIKVGSVTETQGPDVD